VNVFMQSPWNPFFRYYAKVFYMIYEGKFPSIQRNTELYRFSLMGEIDGLGFSLIDFYVPAIRPRFHRSETALHLPENITCVAICHIETLVIREG